MSAISNAEYSKREATIAPTILTVEGEYFDFTNPGNSVFTANTIAHALSNICRFTGHCRAFYSVAQHSVLVSHLVPQELAMHGLMHDAAEAFVGDMSSPLKKMLPEYKSIEKRIEAAVFARFGLPAEMPPEVKHADMVALRTEQRDLMSKRGGLWTFLEGIQPHDKRIEPMLPRDAAYLFLDRYIELTQRINGD